MDEINLLIASDIHAAHESVKDTRVHIEQHFAGKNPLYDFVSFCKTYKNKIDYIIVPGDITDKANEDALGYCWKALNEAACHLSARLISVPGNHDIETSTLVDNRYEYLTRLELPYPTYKESLNKEFFTKGWTIIEEDNHRILLIDSTFGFPPLPDALSMFEDYQRELRFGCCSDKLISTLHSYLSVAEEKLNIAVLHHHPQEHQKRSYLKDYCTMTDGDALIEALSIHALQSGSWFIVHGHKHIPQLISNKLHSNNGPSILCSASLGSRLWDPVDTIACNQFHIVQLYNNEQYNSLCGSVKSFSWGYGVPWKLSDRSEKSFPPNSGFGYPFGMKILGDQLISFMNTNMRTILERDELFMNFPDLHNVLPDDYISLEKYLRENGFSFLDDHHSREICQLQRGVFL